MQFIYLLSRSLRRRRWWESSFLSSDFPPLTSQLSSLSSSWTISTLPILSSIIIFCFLHCAMLVDAADKSHSQGRPSVDISQLGRVALAGDFDTISLYEYTPQTSDSVNSSTILAPGTQSISIRLPNGVFQSIALADGLINVVCGLNTSSTPQIFMGGNFTSLGGKPASGIAYIDSRDFSVHPIPGISGRVSTILCDSTTGIVYIGGSFAAGPSSNAVSLVNGQIAHLPFNGFTGPVSSIIKSSNGSIIFGGEFDGLLNRPPPPREDLLHTVPLSSARITASPPSNRANDVSLNDPRSIILCQPTNFDNRGSGSSWLGPDDNPAFWQANLRFTFVPTKLRFLNSNLPSHGAKTWRITALPLNGILNISYTDDNGNMRFCDARCPLQRDSSIYQDFYFVNPIAIKSFRIDISEWYGEGAGLSGIRLYQDDIYAFAANKFNQPICDGSVGASSTLIGPWLETHSDQSTSDYMTAAFDTEQINPDTVSVDFQPDIKQPGFYTATMFTPGCVQDNTCSTRGKVTLNGNLGSGLAPVEVYQTNAYDKYDRIFFGFVNSSTSGEVNSQGLTSQQRPTVSLKPSGQQNGYFTFVAQRLRFEFVTPGVGLNGIFEFDTRRRLVDPALSSHPIDKSLRSAASGAKVYTMADFEGRLFVGGDFKAPSFSNLYSMKNSVIIPVRGGGLNGPVHILHLRGNILYVGGTFTGTRDGSVTGLNNIAMYHIIENVWYNLGAGVNGLVNDIVPMKLNVTVDKPEEVLGISGSFDKIFGYKGFEESFDVREIAIWLESKQTWLQNVNPSLASFQGKLTGIQRIPGLPELFTGSVTALGIKASGTVGLGLSKGKLALLPLPLKIKSRKKNSTELHKRDLVLNENEDVNGVLAGMMYLENKVNVTILGGHFESVASDNTTLRNVLFLNGTRKPDNIHGLPTGILDDRSIVRAIGTHATTLFIGGSIRGFFKGSRINGLILYDLIKSRLLPTQPPALTGNLVSVNAIAPRPNSTDIFVGGRFMGAGSFHCPALCIFNLDRSQWISPRNGFHGIVSSLTWLDQRRILVGGAFSVNEKAYTLSVFDAQSRLFNNISVSTPGPVTSVTLANKERSQFFVAGYRANGSSYVGKYDNKGWVEIPGLSPNSHVRSMQVLQMRVNHRPTRVLEPNLGLLVLGRLTLPKYGEVAGALFDGREYSPFFLAQLGDNASGSIAQAFVENPLNFFVPPKRLMPVGFVILISFALALVITSLVVLLGLFAERIRRRREGYMPTSRRIHRTIRSIQPEQLLSSLKSHCVHRRRRTAS